MKKFILLPFFILFGFTTYAQKKITYGVGIDIFQTKLNNVDKKAYNTFGLTVTDFNYKDRLGLGLNGLIRMQLYKGLGIESGLGLVQYHTQYHFKYFHSFPFAHPQQEEDFNVTLNYGKIPLHLFYNIKLSDNTIFILSAGINVKALLWVNDKIGAIEFNKRGILEPYERYTPIVKEYVAGISYNYQFKHGSTIGFGLNFGIDIDKTVKNYKEMSFHPSAYQNLQNVYYAQYGISLKYFFTH